VGKKAFLEKNHTSKFIRLSAFLKAPKIRVAIGPSPCGLKTVNYTLFDKDSTVETTGFLHVWLTAEPE